MSNIELLKDTLRDKGIEYKIDHDLAPYTTWKIGGKADLFVTTNSRENLLFILTNAQKHKIPYTIIGWGSNILISDEGITGLVIRNTSKRIEINNNGKVETIDSNKPEVHLQEVDTQNYYSFKDLDYDESEFPLIEVEVDSGVSLPYLINTLIDKGITGLQWFAGIPGTVGGAVYNNIHGGSYFISEYVKSVLALDDKGHTINYSPDKLDFDYDYSIFHTNNDAIISIKLLLRLGNKERARQTYISWMTRKRIQPSNSAGCILQNIDADTQKKYNLESNSWGYIIDKVLNLKGYRVGKAHISHKHAAFIETEQGAKATDILKILEKIHTESQKQLGIIPTKSEIIFLGFKENEISKYK